MPGKTDAVEIVAALVQSHQHGFLRVRRNCRRPSAIRVAASRARFGNFMNIERKNQLAAEVVESFAVALGQLPLRACFSRPIEMTTRRMSAARCAHADSHRLVRQIAFAAVGTCVHNLSSCRITDLGSEYVHDHVPGINQDPVAIGQALDVEVLDSGFLQAWQHFPRSRRTCRWPGPRC